MNGDRYFADTNLLLYSMDTSEPAKQARAWDWLDALWKQSSGNLSWQVLHEFYVNATRKMNVEVRLARKLVHSYASWQPIDTTAGLIERAWYWTDVAQLSYWDALIVAAAERAGCGTLLSEDFQAGRKFGTVTVVNPFGSVAGPATRQ